MDLASTMSSGPLALRGDTVDWRFWNALGEVAAQKVALVICTLGVTHGEAWTCTRLERARLGNDMEAGHAVGRRFWVNVEPHRSVAIRLRLRTRDDAPARARDCALSFSSVILRHGSGFHSSASDGFTTQCRVQNVKSTTTDRCRHPSHGQHLRVSLFSTEHVYSTACKTRSTVYPRVTLNT